MPELPGPIEWLELAPGESRTLDVLSFEEGETTIKPANAPAGKVIPVMRLHLAPGNKPTPPNYFDTSSLTLQHQLRPVLLGAAVGGKRVTVTKVGSGPSARFTTDFAPLQVAPTT